MARMLAKSLGGGVVRCLACNRYCVIKEGNAGFCGVRANVKGKLTLTVHSKPAAVWVDPIEKKPFFHFLPGSTSFSLGTYGCNFACDFCFVPDTNIVNDDSIKRLDEAFEECTKKIQKPDGEIGFANGRKTITAKGIRKNIDKVFMHHYDGDMLTIKPRHAPSVTCTPEHRFFVYKNAVVGKVPAADLKIGDLLLVPKLKPKNEDTVIDARKILENHISRIKKARKLDKNGLNKLLKLKKSGKTSREIGKILRMHPAYLRKLLGNLKRTGITEDTFSHDNIIIEDGARLRYKMEKGNGIPSFLDVNEEFAELLGYYCAEGNTAKPRARPSSYNVVFSYGKHEKHLIERTAVLLNKIFRVKPKLLRRRTTITVEVSGSSLGILFKELCGERAKHKKVPSQVARSRVAVINSFMKAFLAGDGCIMKDKIAFNSVSKKLALGLYNLLLLLGYLPSFYEWVPPKKKMIEGRIVNQSTLYYVKLQAEKFRNGFLGNDCKPRKKSEENLKFKETDSHWLVPIFKIEKSRYHGPVYNCEVDGDHSYLANFIAVCNCQNWDLSQAPAELRAKNPSKWKEYFKNLVDKVEAWPPERVVEEAIRSGCRSIAFTYSEPTIFTEYALDVMKLARKKGLKGVYVTNGYESSECWKAIKGHIDAANIDLKAYNQRFYTELCKTPNFEKIKESIILAKKLGIWVEVTTLIVPGWNDNENELNEEAKWLTSVDPLMPWHVTAFHPDYKMRDTEETTPESLVRAREIAKMAGLKYVYCGNVSLAYSEYETTACHKCGKTLVSRYGYNITENNVSDGRCRNCKEKIPGIWK